MGPCSLFCFHSEQRYLCSHTTHSVCTVHVKVSVQCPHLDIQMLRCASMSSSRSEYQVCVSRTAIEGLDTTRCSVCECVRACVRA